MMIKVKNHQTVETNRTDAALQYYEGFNKSHKNVILIIPAHSISLTHLTSISEPCCRIAPAVNHNEF